LSHESERSAGDSQKGSFSSRSKIPAGPARAGPAGGKGNPGAHTAPAPLHTRRDKDSKCPEHHSAWPDDRHPASALETCRRPHRGSPRLSCLSTSLYHPDPLTRQAYHLVHHLLYALTGGVHFNTALRLLERALHPRRILRIPRDHLLNDLLHD
jgi:hypothetical protein